MCFIPWVFGTKCMIGSNFKNTFKAGIIGSNYSNLLSTQIVSFFFLSHNNNRKGKQKANCYKNLIVFHYCRRVGIKWHFAQTVFL